VACLQSGISDKYLNGVVWNLEKYPMADREMVKARRHSVAQYLMHHVDSPVEITKNMGEKWPEISIDTVKNDIRAIRKSASPWLVGLAKEGYIYDVMLGVKKIMEHEKELEAMKQKTTDLKEKREIIRQIDETVIARLSLEGEGPVFLAVTSRK